MKMLNLTVLFAGAFLFLPAITYGQAIATDVTVYNFPCPIPNTLTSQEFVTARDQFMNDLKTVGHPVITGSRVGHTSAIETRTVYTASDICVSSNSILWRGKFDLPAPYNLRGGRIYNPSVIIGNDGKISLNRLDHLESCTIAIYNSSSSLAGLDYSVSRIGVLAGPDQILFTADDSYLSSGAGTNLVDAVVFSGGRIGSEVNSQADINSLNAAISQLGTNGMNVTFEYHYVLSPGHFTVHNFTAKVYPDGMIPGFLNRIILLPAPRNGVLFSFMGQENSPVTFMSGASPNGPWSPSGASPNEGASALSSLIGQRFFRLATNSSAFTPSSTAFAKSLYLEAPLVPNSSSEKDQDNLIGK